MGETVEGEIVFTHPIPVDEYIAFMEKLDLTPKSNRIEGEEAAGRWVGLTAPPTADGTALDWPLLEQSLVNDKLGTHVVGVVAAIGVDIDASTSGKLKNHPWVYAIPSMASWIDNEIVVKYPEVDVTRMYVQPSLLYHYMKKVGIAEPYD